MKLIKITKKQQEILILLFKFRFLTTDQIQQLLNHKEGRRIKAWLLDLIKKEYVKRIYDPKSFQEKTKPAIYYLAPKARKILEQEIQVDLSQLEYIYKEHNRKDSFINHNLFLANIYLFLLERLDKKEEIKFFTKYELKEYEHFPDPLPDAFVAIKGKDKTKRYFIDLFDELTPPFVIRKRVRKYLDYVESSEWDEKTNYTPFPMLLFVCPRESVKTHIYKYTQALLEKTYEDKISLYLTTKPMIQFSEKTDNIWQKVE